MTSRIPKQKITIRKRLFTKGWLLILLKIVVPFVRKFRLSHTSPVDPPLETAAALDASFLNRYEVVLAEAIYNRCLRAGKASHNSNS